MSFMKSAMAERMPDPFMDNQIIRDQLQRHIYEYEALIGKLRELLEKDDVDEARDLVEYQYRAIHGPSD